MRCVANANIDCMEDRCESWSLCKLQMLPYINERDILTLKSGFKTIVETLKQQNEKISKLDKEIKKNARTSKSQVARKSKQCP